MADQLFPVFDLPQEPDIAQEQEEKYRPSVYFDFATGDFLRDGANRIVPSTGHEAWLQWCQKIVSTERESCLCYGDDIGTEFEELNDLEDGETVESEIERTITEALLVHPATEWVRNFEFERDGEAIHVAFDLKGYPWEDIDTLAITL